MPLLRDRSRNLHCKWGEGEEGNSEGWGTRKEKHFDVFRGRISSTMMMFLGGGSTEGMCSLEYRLSTCYIVDYAYTSSFVQKARRLHFQESRL